MKETIRDLMELKYTGTQVLGCHMEGPFISKAKKGAQAEENMDKAAAWLAQQLAEV